MKIFCKTLGIAAVMGVQLMMLHSCCKHNSSDDDMRVLPIVMNTVQAGTKAIIDNPDGEERLKQMMNACYDDQHNNVGGFGVYGYKKAGVVITKLVQEEGFAHSLFSDVGALEKESKLSESIDSIHKAFGRGAILLRSQGSGEIKMSREHQSPHYTTLWSDIPKTSVR